MSESADMEKRRIRTALMALSGGVILIVWAWVSWMYRTSIPPRVDEFAGPLEDPATASDSALTQLAQLIYVAGVVLLASLIALGAFSRGWRRYMGNLLRRRPEPTPNEDTWSMHQIADDEVSTGSPTSSD